MDTVTLMLMVLFPVVLLVPEFRLLAVMLPAVSQSEETELGPAAGAQRGGSTAAAGCAGANASGDVAYVVSGVVSLLTYRQLRCCWFR